MVRSIDNGVDKICLTHCATYDIVYLSINKRMSNTSEAWAKQQEESQDDYKEMKDQQASYEMFEDWKNKESYE